MAKGSRFREDLNKKLVNPAFAADFLAAAIEENDENFLGEALAKVVKVHGPSKISEETGITRQAIYKMLSSDGNPSFRNVHKLLEAVGLELTIRPKKDAS